MSPMIKKKTSELEGVQLDWAVATASGLDVTVEDNGLYRVLAGTICLGWVGKQYSPSTEWSQAGPIIERERIWLAAPIGERHEWDASVADSTDGSRASTPLIAAMRAFVASKLGDEVEVPV